MKDINFDEPQIVVCVGRPKQGKSNAVKYFLLKNMMNEPKFKFGIVFSKTKFNESYNYIPDQYIYTEYSPEILQQYMDGLQKLKEDTGEIPPNFIIFEDQQGLLNRQDTVLTTLISSHRHFLSTCFFNFQYLFGASPLLRECTTYAILFRSQGHRTINGLFENFGMLFDNINDFKKYFLKNTKKKYVAILYKQSENKLEKNYKRFKAPDMTDFVGFQLQY
jgi:hypothetical protein